MSARRRFPLGRWSLYLDPTRAGSIGRATSDTSVVYSLLGLTAEHYRPQGYAERAEIDRHAARILHWQRIRDTLWRRSEWECPLRPGETYESWAGRRWQYTQVRYRARAEDARARRQTVPTVEELRLRAPVGVPAAAYTSPAATQ